MLKLFKQKNINIKRKVLFFLYLFLFGITISFSQNNSNNLNKLNLPFSVDFTTSELRILNSLTQSDLEKLIRIVKLMLDRNASNKIQDLTGNNFSSTQTTYSNSQTSQTPYYNSSTGQYQSAPASSNNTNPYSNNLPFSGQQQSQSPFSPTQVPKTAVGSLVEGLNQGLQTTFTPPSAENCGGEGHHGEMAGVLNGMGIKISSSGGCSDQNNASCTSLEQMPRKITLLLSGIKEKCPNCNMTITGGTEVGHKTHKPKLAIFDMSIKDAATNNFIKTNGKYMGQSGIFQAIYQYENVLFNYEVPGNGPVHWHVDARGYACKAAAKN